jgi:hypothetical protein
MDKEIFEDFQLHIFFASFTLKLFNHHRERKDLSLK